MNNTDDSFDDIQIEGEGGAFNEDAPEAQQPEMPTDGTVDDKWLSLIHISEPTRLL